MKHLQLVLHCITLIVVKKKKEGRICGDTMHFKETNLMHDNQEYFLTDSLQAISISTKDVYWILDK